MKNEYYLRIALGISTQVIYNLLWKYLSRSIDSKLLLVGLYFFAFTVAGVYFIFQNKSLNYESLRNWKILLLLLCAAVATNIFQYCSSVIARSEFSITSYRLITSIGFISILLFLESLIYGDKITSQKLIGVLFGFVSLYFLMK